MHYFALQSLLCIVFWQSCHFSGWKERRPKKPEENAPHSLWCNADQRPVLSCPVLSSGRTCRVVLLFTVSLSMWTLWNSHLVKSHLWCFLKYATSLLNMCLNSSRYGCNLTSHTEKKDTQREGNHFLSPRATTSWMLYWKLQVGGNDIYFGFCRDWPSFIWSLSWIIQVRSFPVHW